MTKTFFRYFTLADFEAQENWLKEQSKAGWKLVRAGIFGGFKFEQAQPEDLNYRLVYREEKMTIELQRKYEERGWEYVGEDANWFYFRKPAADAAAEEDGDLFADNSSRINRVKQALAIRTLPLFAIGLSCMLTMIDYFRRNDGGGIGSVCVFIVFLGLVMISMFEFLLTCSKIKKLKEKYAA